MSEQAKFDMTTSEKEEQETEHHTNIDHIHM